MTQIPDQTDVVKVLGRDSITEPFLGNAIEIAIVTRDHKRTMEGLCCLGIGPWQVHTFSPDRMKRQVKGERGGKRKRKKTTNKETKVIDKRVKKGG